MAPDTQAMQNDDTANPGMLWVLDGEALWKKKAGSADKACADCHGDAGASMKGVAARYPAFDKALGRPVDLEQRINLCRADQQQATPLAYESRDLLALTAFVAQQSRGAAIDDRRRSAAKTLHRKGPRAVQRSGRASSISPAPIAMTTIGTSGWRVSAITQGHPTGYPIYRLEWQIARLAAAAAAGLHDRHPGAAL